VNKDNVLLIVVALIVGFLGGFLILNFSGHKEELPANVSVPQGAGSPMDYQKRIAEEEKMVAQDPKNAQVWNQLGNDYFDTDQPQKAVNAYSKVLELQPNNVNTLTDQGIMYRKLRWYDKAIENFQKAQQIQPGHLQSLYNLGIVYAADLKQPEKAREVWTKYLQFDSTSPTAQQIKQELSAMPKGMGK
jgi:tetratricopeptide (TPR) repeat protein